MVYTAESDPLCYPDTTVLRNKLDLTDQSELDEFETTMFVLRSEEPWLEGNLDVTHYLALHHHLFQDVYDWGGEIRTIRIGKGGNWFCYPEFVANELNRIFQGLARADYFEGLTPADFAAQAAHLLAEINAIHPFREGNGRTQLTFLALLARHVGLPFNAEVLDRERVIEAMIESFAGSEQPLATLIFDIVTEP
ncbi:Fic/DOC family protein [Rhizobium leguminosarum]|uniref:Fic/DOC family protein n=1 Tax=Rhizobium leguminosarum TaxID=384 RepID=UPI001442445E|nr:Fic family protein [Rhizobium leguminosarum]MBY5870200.1 adenosine monophosphate-protein transferase [Rhizobium leguminosarum]NKM08914.1 adenosine monophosphate-protein transferase [Rhizobium leguminosarum bv. viciae]